ncbi:hypothetical protein FOJ82_12865 [Tessaracoccus rhinocerotis]|uniref:DUF998 domain-containing protein n=1 Tax=Tessaracoccus rhinocerotis TaxID=1689449 RepID=A0A553JYA3_9ACTN|nr:DUF998 domain-containing protein [Tessaracoccus rhinocerotis]TRY17420.1 hypothetical protein FOJ82_12865 [Tessaracoccus rhinocerotis]
MTLPVARDSRRENLSLLLGGIGMLIGGLVGIFVLGPESRLFGRGSVGEVAAATALPVSALAFGFAMNFVMARVRPWLRQLPKFRQVYSILGLALVHGALATLVTVGLFSVFNEAFRGVLLDNWVGAFMVGVVCGISAYATAASATALTTESLSQLVAVFLVVGALASALNASNELWWQVHFSALGATLDASGIVFNFTLILTGVVLITLADFLTHDLRTWAERVGERRWKVGAIRLSLIAMGLCLAGIGSFPVTFSRFGHNFFTYSLMYVFAATLVAVPILFRRLPGGFIGVTVVTIVLTVTFVYLRNGIDYLNVTAFEIVAVALVFVWLLLFVRTVSAALVDQPRPRPAAVRESVSSAERAALDRSGEPARDG